MVLEKRTFLKLPTQHLQLAGKKAVSQQAARQQKL